MPWNSDQSQYGNYRVTSTHDISEIQSHLIELIHEPTGAQILHLANDDDENLFNLSFRTWPPSSNGVAHILEHTVLCGSKKFPVHDPFFAMYRRSLNTFMNALTGPDFTCYPAATQVPKDFYNLLEVYLDAVFEPKLTQLSFLQEGHRLEFLEPENPNSPLVFKGIVFNEMKGALATGDARLGEELMAALFPNLTYGVNSGGDPKEILNLTYEELKTFHQQFYHPSRCLFYFYGNLPLEQHLDFLEEHIFKNTQPTSQLPLLPKQPRFKKKVESRHTYPVSEEEEIEDKTLVGMGWLTCSILDQDELLGLNVLDLVLMGTDASPLKQALLKSNLCKQADTSLETEISEVPYILVCKGCKEEETAKLEEFVFKTLRDIAKEGFPENLVEGSIHQLEMSRKEITGNSSPYGLSLFFRSALLKQHGGNPEDGLRIHTLFHRLREAVKNPHYLTGLIEKYLLKNTHFVRLDMVPDKTLAAKELAEEKKVLEERVASLSDKDVKKILDESKELLAYQESFEDEDLEILPKVTLEDVERKGKDFPLKKESLGKFNIFHHACFTNDLLYVDLMFDLPKIPESDLPLLRLFSHLLPQMGCGGRTYQQHLEYLLEHTGGIGVSLDLSLQADDANAMRPALSLRGKALYRKLDKLFPILRDVALSADFTDIPRLKELLMQHYNGLENSIQHSSLRYAVNLAASGLSVPSKIINDWYGLNYFWAIKEVIAEFERNPETLIQKMQQLQKLCLGSEKGLKESDLVLGCDESAYTLLKKEHFYGLFDPPSQKDAPHVSPKWEDNLYQLPEVHSQARITASPVAFNVLLFASAPYTDPHTPALCLASQIMENNVLHKRIREQGGAYGSGAVNGVLSGQFYFYAHRDPHLSTTLDAFREAVEMLVQGDFDDEDLMEAKLGIFQDLDAPTPPSGRAMAAYSRLRGGRTKERRQEYRERLFNATKQDIQQAAKEFLLPGLKTGVLVSFSGKDLLEKESLLLKEPLPIYNI